MGAFKAPCVKPTTLWSSSRLLLCPFLSVELTAEDRQAIKDQYDPLADCREVRLCVYVQVASSAISCE